jgi:formylglycine-generating enzyme required for sulfatase activity
LCDPDRQTWTPTVGANEVRAIICTDWFEGAAFCIWDGGFLPSEAEWNFAAAGGAEQRVYPWGGTTIDDAHAVYCGGTCSSAQNVGTKSPLGDGKYGHVDIAGNAWEWTLDWYNAYTVPCTDCADTSAGTTRVVRGGSFYDGSPSQLVANRNGSASPTHRDGATGIRCARLP